MSPPGLIFAIESSCDESAAAVVARGDHSLSNAVASQIAVHAPHGGVVPELAARHHLENLMPVIQEAEREAGVTIAECDAIAVTAGPGLIGCLLLGVETAKTLAVAHGKPLIGVNHLAAHLYSPLMNEPGRLGFGEGDFAHPYLGLLVSGGHSELVICHEPTRWEPLGQTLDDAAGEAYDKVAKLLGLGYPGGPVIDRRAQEGDPTAFPFPRPMLKKASSDFSFSGLKTAVRLQVEALGIPEKTNGSSEALINDLCASFQAAVIDTLLTKTERAMVRHRLSRVAICGGVAANRGLRAEAERRLAGNRIQIPPMSLCTDNAAMIGGVAWHQLQAGERMALDASARPHWPLRG
ncbi:tRNA (adenosine(37)-N6)-threonylcarbamoyltransferase complex transferase subunit TsaD [Candidatus Sumerlaeota bacterium]|nr:tRNA (adenosine(37)-N6)-threonylcarbamoyltransferase complex transferase subunit TsaD [Candidatus Sumerlaeota bacterium]